MVRLARRYAIVTPYTSYLILEDERRRNVPHMSRTIEGQARGRGYSEAELEDRVAEAASDYRRMQNERSGARAVGDAQSAQKLRQADRLDAPKAAARYAAGADNVVGKKPETGAATQPAGASRQKFAGGRAFYQRGKQWIDATIQGRPDAERIELAIGSDRYFKLMREHPEAREWLSVGRQVQFRLDDTVYVVR